MTDYAGLHDIGCTNDPCTCADVPLFEVRAVPKLPQRLRQPKGMDRNTREAALTRAGYVCERCGTNGWHEVLDVHHKRNRSQGGTDSLDNLAVLCRPCHRWVTEHPKDSRVEGWTV